MDLPKILVPKSVWKSTTFWLTLGVVLLLTVVAILQMNGVVVPGWLGLLISIVTSIFTISEKFKDGVTASAKILTDVNAKDLLNLKKPIVNEQPAKVMTGVGVVLASIYGVLTSQAGVVIDPMVIIAIETVIGTFVGFDKLKAAKIYTAEALVKKKG